MEKRGRQRKKTRLSVRFGAERPEKLGFITDVSTGGVYISTNTVFPQGSVVHLQVQLPGGEKLLLQGRVMRARRVASSLVMMMSGGMGVRLENPPPNWRASLSLEDE